MHVQRSVLTSCTLHRTFWAPSAAGKQARPIVRFRVSLHIRTYMLICMRMHHVACVHISDAIAFAGDYYEVVVHEETCGLMVL